jgi:diguanylate cyclase (GGDEF)-like protein/PAS domain S-box-containing protein
MISSLFLRALTVVASFFIVAKVALAVDSTTIGVLGFRPAAEDAQRWQPLVDHLNARVPGHRFQAAVLGYGDLEKAIASRSVEFVLTNPGHYVLMTRRNGMSSPLATLVPVENGRAVSSFGGVIFTRAGQGDIKQVADIRGHTVAATSRGSLGGYQAQAMELLGQGISIPEDARLIETDMPHDRVVAAVLDGKADVGFVRSGVLEAMAHEGRLDMNRLQILAPRNVTGFPYLLSTTLYPEWPFAAMPGIDDDLARQVAAALFDLPHDGSAARRMGIHGFNIPDDYGSVLAVLEALRLPPFDTAPRFTLADIWHKYRTESVIGALLVGIIAVLGIWSLLLNRRIGQKAGEWESLLTALGEGVFGVDPNGRCTFINPAGAAMLGYRQDELLGQDMHALIHHSYDDGTPYPGTACPVLNTLSDGQVRHAEGSFMGKSGSVLPVAITATPVGARKGGREAVVVVFRDVSQHVRRVTQLREEAATDDLTGLPNRRHFLAELERHWADIVLTGDGQIAVLMLDLDHFKDINDTYGHATGDEVLKHFSAMVNDVLRKDDLVGRLGGEEFAVLLFGAGEGDAHQLAHRIRQQVAESAVEVGGRSLRYTTSIGITVLTPSDRDPHEALSRADAALYLAKDRGRNRIEWMPPPPLPQ